VTGLAGSDGANGTDGVLRTGTQGNKGETGIAGSNGANGTDGLTGTWNTRK
jgi:hypothetical protein